VLPPAIGLYNKVRRSMSAGTDLSIKLKLQPIEWNWFVL